MAKANDIYTRWSNGHEIPTVVLRHTDDYPDTQGVALQPTTDSFQNAHRSLSQCISEVHDRAKLILPLRKPCQCSARAASACPPSHSWAPPPKLSPTVPVLPELYLSTLARGVVATGGSAPISPTSKFAVVDTLNFELGAINPSTDQSWMAWF